tara:strand:+ start:4051 stop:4269 length:219 start_codon:yes stop_codon:yes gene_type:complete
MRVTDLEATLNSIRLDRDRRLKSSDWTQTLDNQLTEEQQEQWKIYRQKLRDMPSVYEQNPVEENTFTPIAPF